VGFVRLLISISSSESNVGAPSVSTHSSHSFVAFHGVFLKYCLQLLQNILVLPVFVIVIIFELVPLTNAGMLWGIPT
jgi:hypothetical protein